MKGGLAMKISIHKKKIVIEPEQNEELLLRENDNGDLIIKKI